MVDKILNTEYYKSLHLAFSENLEFNSSLLPISNFSKINLSFVKKAMDIATHFDLVIRIPRQFESLMNELFTNLYLFVANFQFYDNYLNQGFIVNDLVVRKAGKKNRKYKVVKITDEVITLVEQKKGSLKDMNGPAIIYIDRKNIVKEFIPIKRALKKNSLNNYLKLFSRLNKLDVKEDFFPTKFGSVSIFIGAKKILDGFRNIPILDSNLWNSIPCYYINRDGEESDTMGIEPLLYFVPSYRIAYQQIVQHKKINNIVLFNDGFDELQQIISDQFQYGFRILGICLPPIENRVNTIKYWEWNKEEINIIETL